eukprot:15339103-Ditylum_brightwellii.AAC.2
MEWSEGHVVGRRCEKTLNGREGHCVHCQQWRHRCYGICRENLWHRNNVKRRRVWLGLEQE